jgi:hypothetical protein
MNLIKEIKYERKCWWCGNFADSREHKIKNTDFSAMYGKGDLKKTPDGAPFLVINGNSKEEKVRQIQSSTSDWLQYEYNFCKECNTKKSRNFDIDYEIFSKYVANNVNDIIKTSSIDFRKVFDDDNYLEHKKNVIKYYIKRACCEISRPTKHNTCYEIADEIKQFLNNEGDLSYFNFEFQIKLPLLLAEQLIPDYKNISLHQAIMYIFTNEVGFRHAHFISSGYTYRWFSMNYIYCYDILESQYLGYHEYYDNPILNVEVIDFDKLPSLTGITNHFEFKKLLDNCDIDTDDKFGSSRCERLLNKNQFQK